MQEHSFNLLVNGVPYLVKAKPFEFNTETRFTINYNSSDDHIFAWDSQVGSLIAIDDDAINIPDDLEIAISEKLLSGKF
ncbi:MAG TPA: hypothetical protein VGO09_10730 [Flavisolibacter sp.]|jgi:hypothetical protein|nr:hypothetical protein [Flavisolibacter sp.]